MLINTNKLNYNSKNISYRRVLGDIDTIHFYKKKHSLNNLMIFIQLFYNTKPFNFIFMQPWLSTTDQNLTKTSLAMRLLEVFLDESIDIGLCMIPTLKTIKFVHNFWYIFMCMFKNCVCFYIVYKSCHTDKIYHFKLSLTGCHKIKTNIFLLNFSSFL